MVSKFCFILTSLEHVPLTFLVKNGHKDSTFHEFLEQANFNNKKIKSEYWIIKPGENSNRGKGIRVCNTVEQIKQFMDSSKRKSYIIQKYITNPLLICGRKFDIRCFAVFTSINKHK